VIELPASPSTAGWIAVERSDCGAEPGTFSNLSSPGDWSLSPLDLVGLANSDLLLPELSPSSPKQIGFVLVNRMSLPADLSVEPDFPKCFLFRFPIEVPGRILSSILFSFVPIVGLLSDLFENLDEIGVKDSSSGVDDMRLNSCSAVLGATAPGIRNGLRRALRQLVGF